MHKDELIKLAERCEAAEGPNFELEMEIGRAVAPNFKEMWRSTIGRPAPAYTASLDAAMTLIPADLFPTIDFVTKRVWIRDEKGFDVAWTSAHGFAATVPLSICAAALRARAACLVEGEG